MNSIGGAKRHAYYPSTNQAGRESMKSHAMAAVIAAAAMIATPNFISTASAQPIQSNPSGSYLVPVVVGAAAGATVGALLWPAMIPAGAAMAVAPGAVTATAWGWGSFYTTRAAVGAIIGGGLGYLAAR
jgi:hypothetical protein